MVQATEGCTFRDSPFWCKALELHANTRTHTHTDMRGRSRGDTDTHTYKYTHTHTHRYAYSLESALHQARLETVRSLSLGLGAPSARMVRTRGGSFECASGSLGVAVS